LLDSGDRTIAVGDTTVEFRGVSVNGFPAWAGVTEIDGDCFISLASYGGIPIEHIAVCANWAMSDRPPLSQ